MHNKATGLLFLRVHYFSNVYLSMQEFNAASQLESVVDIFLTLGFSCSSVLERKFSTLKDCEGWTNIMATTFSRYYPLLTFYKLGYKAGHILLQVYKVFSLQIPNTETLKPRIMEVLVPVTN